MLAETHGDITLLRFDHLAREGGFVHAVAGKPHNYAPHRGIGRERAMEARRRVCEILDLPLERLTAPAQVMAGEVLRIEPPDWGRGRDGRSSAIPYVDGLICDSPNVPIVLLSADCPLICAYDPDRRAVGALHVGWQGTVAGAALNLVAQMRRNFGTDPAHLLVGISPSAGPCCYEVGDDVRRIAAARLENADQCLAVRNGRLTFDLWEANRSQLVREGVRPENIELPRICTICDHSFWSHRREGHDAGRNAMFVALKA